MHIKLNPQHRDDTLAVSKQGDTLTINGEVFDFSGVTDGATLPASAVACDFVTGDITREAGVLHITLLLPNSPSASEAARFPAPIINPPDGALELPA